MPCALHLSSTSAPPYSLQRPASAACFHSVQFPQQAATGSCRPPAAGQRRADVRLTGWKNTFLTPSRDAASSSSLMMSEGLRRFALCNVDRVFYITAMFSGLSYRWSACSFFFPRDSVVTLTLLSCPATWPQRRPAILSRRPQLIFLLLFF